MTDPPNGHFDQPPEVQRAVAAVRRARVTEGLFVIAVTVAAFALVTTTAWNTFKVRSLTQQNVKAQDFGLKAVFCILDNFAEHRWSNQAFHDSLAAFFHAPTTPRVPLPNLPTDDQFTNDCAPFNHGKLEAPPTVTPTTPDISTSTTKGTG